MVGLAVRQRAERWAPAASLLLRLAATAWMAWVLAGLLWLLSGHDRTRLLPPPRATQPPAATVDVSQLAGYSLFGQRAPSAADADAAQAPDTSLQLRLAGVFLSADPAHSSAIVAERNNPAAPARAYRVNDGLPGGATLADVFEDRILLKRADGASEILRFEKTNLLGGQAAPAAPAATQDQSNMDARALLQNAVQAMNADPDAFVRQMGLKPGAQGYEVTAATPEALRQSVGLQPGDRLLRVNGRQLGNPQRDRGVLKDVQNGNRVRVEVQRGNQTVTLDRQF